MTKFVYEVPQFSLLLTLFVFVQPMFADVDPAMVGTWETSGVNANGPWKLTWEIQSDSSYVLSGALTDSDVIGSGDGKWHTRSNVTNQMADGTYTIRDANHMLGTGATGSGLWTGVTNKTAARTLGHKRACYAIVFKSVREWSLGALS